MGCYFGLNSEDDCRGTPCNSCTAWDEDKRWYVHVWVCGAYSGYYDFAAEAEAQEDFEYRKKFHVLGASYELTGSPLEPGKG